ncbi:MAG: hypothetical protein LBQ89_07380, partial [Treponema sp.]|nr:hypothetical protein [Treponema sp.]
IIKLLNEERSEKYGEEAKELVEKAREIILKINEKRSFNKDGNEEEGDFWRVLPPRGDTVLRGWDQVTILAQVGDQERVIEELKSAFKAYCANKDIDADKNLNSPHRGAEDADLNSNSPTS